jgi:hypothetical protein
VTGGSRQRRAHKGLLAVRAGRAVPEQLLLAVLAQSWRRAGAELADCSCRLVRLLARCMLDLSAGYAVNGLPTALLVGAWHSGSQKPGSPWGCWLCGRGVVWCTMQN